jgi:hypothetical protein
MSVTAHLECCILTSALATRAIPQLRHGPFYNIVPRANWQSITCIERPVRRSHGTKDEAFRAHTFMHSKGVNSRVKGLTGQCLSVHTAAMCLQMTPAQPCILPGRISICDQVALKVVTPLRYQHLSTLRITAEQSVCYVHGWSNAQAVIHIQQFLYIC